MATKTQFWSPYIISIVDNLATKNVFWITSDYYYLSLLIEFWIAFNCLVFTQWELSKTYYMTPFQIQSTKSKIFLLSFNVQNVSDGNQNLMLIAIQCLRFLKWWHKPNISCYIKNNWKFLISNNFWGTAWKKLDTYQNVLCNQK